MTNCKNCKYTDEYCASGDCTLGYNNLTEQWKKGELPEGWYWVKKKTCEEYIDKVYFWYDTFIDGDVPLDNDKVIEVLAPVPSYEEWQALNESDKRNAQSSIRFSIEAAILRELLKECKPYFEALVDKRLKLEYIPQVYELLTKIDEVLNAK